MTHPEFERKFRDRISGFEGTCTGIARYLDGSARRQVHSRRAHSFLCVFQKKGTRSTIRIEQDRDHS